MWEDGGDAEEDTDLIAALKVRSLASTPSFDISSSRARLASTCSGSVGSRQKKKAERGSGGVAVRRGKHKKSRHLMHAECGCGACHGKADTHTDSRLLTIKKGWGGEENSTVAREASSWSNVDVMTYVCVRCMREGGANTRRKLAADEKRQKQKQGGSDGQVGQTQIR